MEGRNDEAYGKRYRHLFYHKVLGQTHTDRQNTQVDDIFELLNKKDIT